MDPGDTARRWLAETLRLAVADGKEEIAMPREPSWREVAHVLAARLEHAATAAGSISPHDNRGGPGCSHSIVDADPDECPFCADRAAFQIYKHKLRSTTNSQPRSRVNDVATRPIQSTT